MAGLESTHGIGAPQRIQRIGAKLRCRTGSPSRPPGNHWNHGEKFPMAESGRMEKIALHFEVGYPQGIPVIKTVDITLTEFSALQTTVKQIR